MLLSTPLRSRRTDPADVWAKYPVVHAPALTAHRPDICGMCHCLLVHAPHSRKPLTEFCVAESDKRYGITDCALACADGGREGQQRTEHV